MSEPKPFSVAAVQQKREQTGPAVAGEPLTNTAPVTMRPAAATGAPTSPPAATGGGLTLPFDPVRLIAAVIKHWKWLPVAALALLLPAVGLGLFKFKTGYEVTVQLIRREVSTTIRASQLGDAFKPRQVTVATIVSVMQSPKLLDRIGGLARPGMTGRELLSRLTIKPERDTDLITVTLKGVGSEQATADLVNLYADEVVKLTAQMQSDEASELHKFLNEQIKQTDAELDAVNKELSEFTRDTEFYGADREVEAYMREVADLDLQLETARAESKTVDFRISSVEHELGRQSPVAMELGKAREELASLRITYTDENPVIKDALDKVAALEKQLADTVAAGSNAVSNFRYTDNTVANELYVQLLDLRGQQEGLTKRLAQLEGLHARIQEKLKSVPETNQRYAQIAARQQTLQMVRDLLAGRQHEAQIYEDNPPGLYRLFAKATEDTVETSSRWKKIILACVGALIVGVGGMLVIICGYELMDMRIVSAGDLKRATGTAVAVRLPDTSHLSAADLAQWRFRAWSQLLRQLKLKSEPRVTLAFTSAKPGEGKSTVIRLLRDAAHERRLPLVMVTNAPAGGGEIKTLPLADALASPELVARHLREQPGAPLELHHDAAWKWSLQNRARWQSAAEAWQQIPALVLLIELPAMTSLDAVLAAELMPVVIWVAASGESQQAEFAQTLKTVEAGEIALAAAVLNREPAAFSRLGFLGHFGLAALMLACWLPSAAPAATNDVYGGDISYSSLKPNFAAWQQKFTVGAGDIFNLRIYGRTDSPRAYVPIGPDGRISFMEAQSVLVEGLTVDEMRARLDEELSKYYRNARTMVTPVEWHSKKYFVLGAVVDRGAYSLDRPLTIIEAVARARGIASGLFEHNTVELADMARAFIVRDGKRLPVDFDRLFNHGDLSQNILIEPGDYIYFPSGTVNEVYVLGAVASPGPLGLTSENTLMGVLTVRGGFLPTAFKQRVLVVRGALDKPQTFVVNVGAILTGKEKDFLLKPKDIIYISEKPWQEGTDLLQMAINAFVQSMTSAWVNNHVRPLISN
jgi:protein involved in polysaccharide export with SLBB domain/uncharacterized protein involved in exopolysaccharide biosynthesis